MEVLFIRIEQEEKELLREEAKKLGMSVTTYCRMILIQSLNKKGVKD